MTSERRNMHTLTYGSDKVYALKIGPLTRSNFFVSFNARVPGYQLPLIPRVSAYIPSPLEFFLFLFALFLGTVSA
jgi:hypothetical protein